MAFDMYLKSQRVSIEHYEEGLFTLINEEDCPKLIELWNNFYNGPRINPNDANDIVHELIKIRENVEGNNVLSVVDKLLPFFSKAYKLQESIRCVSD